MRKLSILLSLFSFLFFFALPSARAADGQYKITANIIDMAKVCYITGIVKDAAGNGVYPAEVTFTCGSMQTKVSTLPGGLFIDNPPPCSDYTITITAPGQKSTSRSGFAVAEDEFLPLALSFLPDISLKDAIQALQVLTRMSPDAIPLDQTGDDKIGLEDAIYTLQVIGDRRGGSGPHTLSIMRVTLSESKTVKISKDKDGDGVDDPFKDAVTDEFGHLEVGGLENGTYSLTAISDEKAVRIENIKIVGRSVHLKTIRMKPVGSISGQALLEGASDHSEIHVFIPGTSFATFTDSEGSFTIPNVPEGTYDLKASKENYGTISLSEVAVESGKDSNIGSVVLDSTVGSVSGAVTLEGTSNYAGILVWLQTSAGTADVTTTSEAGEYTFVDIPVGTYDLVAAMPGYIAEKWAVTISPGQNEQELKVLKINSATGKLTGTVTLDNIDDYTGILVGLAGTQYMAVTGSSGAYTITEIPEGTYTVFMKAEGYGAERYENIQITAGKITTLDGTLYAAAGTKSGSIVGTACYIDKSEHAGISVKVEGTDIPLAGTDTNGGFIISNVPAGTYTLLFTQANYTTVTRMGVVVPPWDTVFIRAVEMVPPFGTIKGKVHLEGGPPHGNVTVSVDGPSITAQSLDDGSFQLSPVPVGTYTVTAYKAGYIQGQVTGVVVGPGQTVNLSSPIKLNKPPKPPTGVTASQASGSSVNVEWTASESTDVAGYNVYFSTRSDVIDQNANEELIKDPIDNKWQFEVTGLEKGVKYYFAVKAVDKDDLKSDLSQSASTEIIPHAPRPPAPSEIKEPDSQFVFPEAICIGRDGERGYVTNPGNKVVSLIDLGTATVTGTIVVGRHPSDLAANPKRDEVYCVNKESNTVTVIDSTQTDPDQAVIKTFPTADLPVRGLVSADGKYLFVSCIGEGADSITVIDLNTGSEIEESPISVGADPQGMTIANNKLYVANEWDNNVSVIDIDPTSSSRWQKLAYNISVGKSPADLATSQDGSFVYVVNSGSDTVSVIDTATDQVIDTLTVGDCPLRMATSGNILYVINYRDGNVSMINMTTNTVLSSTFVVGNYPKGIAVTADGETIYVVNNGSESVSIRKY